MSVNYVLDTDAKQALLNPNQTLAAKGGPMLSLYNSNTLLKNSF